MQGYDAQGRWRRKDFTDSTRIGRLHRRICHKLRLSSLATKTVWRSGPRQKQMTANGNACNPRAALKPLEIDGLGMAALGLLFLLTAGSVAAQIIVMRHSEKPGCGNGDALTVRARERVPMPLRDLDFRAE